MRVNALDVDGVQAVASDMTQFAALTLSGKTYRVRSARDDNRGFSGDNSVPVDADTDVHTDVRTGDEHVRTLLRLLDSLQVDLLVCVLLVFDVVLLVSLVLVGVVLDSEVLLCVLVVLLVAEALV